MTEHHVYSKQLGPKGRAKFFALNPSLIGTVGDYTFYECPVRGDESSLYAVNKVDGSWGRTWHHDVPSLDEVYA